MKHEGHLEGREWQPRSARIDVGYDVLVRSAVGVVRAKVLNVSNKGFRLKARSPLEPGSQVRLEMHKVEPVSAVIRWACGLDCGGVFVEAAAL